jgi:hypothetical protein
MKIVLGSYAGVVKMTIKIFLAWYDCWIGAFYDRKNKILYICPLPMIVIQVGMK